MDVALIDVTATSISFQWGPVECIHLNGPLLGYIITYHGPDGVEETLGVYTNSDRGNVTISGLEASVTYNVRIGAENLDGLSPTSGFVVRTHGRYVCL